MEMSEDPDLYQKALESEKYGKDQQAIELYNEFINTNLKNTHEQKTETAKLTNLKERLALAYNNRGFLKYKQVDFDGAVDDYTRSLNINSNAAVTYYNRGMVHYRLSRFDEAIADMKNCLSIDPGFKDAQTGLSMSERDKEEKRNRQW